MEAKKLPISWATMEPVEKEVWFVENYSTGEDDENGCPLYDTEAMPNDVLEAYKEVVEGKKEAMASGFILY